MRRAATPISISSFEVDGNQKTHLSLFQNEFNQASRAKDLRELEKYLGLATQRLRSMDIFSMVDIQLTVLSDRPQMKELSVLVKVKEKNVPTLKAETFFGSEGNNVGATIQGALRNLTGYGDISKVSYGTNSAGSKDSQISLSLPSVTSHLHSVDLTARIFEDSSQALYSSFSKNAASIALTASSLDKRHKFVLQSAIRDEVPVGAMTPSINTNGNSSEPSNVYGNSSYFGLLQGVLTPSKQSSPSTLCLLSPSSKTSLSYVHTQDSRDCSSHPTVGSLFSSLIEMAVPPGTAQYLRTELMAEKHETLMKNSVSPHQSIVGSVCASLSTTRLIDWSAPHCNDNALQFNEKAQRKHFSLSDRYFMGGPMSLRGFELFGAGARGTRVGNNQSAGDSLGGLSKLSALFALSSSLPFQYKATESMRTILFLNGGVLLPHSIFPLAGSFPLHNVLEYLRLSVGAGISYSLGPARLELSYALPLLASSHDRLKSFQIGVALGMNS